MSERSEPHIHEADFTEGCDGTNPITKQDAQLIEGITIQDDGLQTQCSRTGTNMFSSKSESALWRKDSKELELDQSIKNSINLMTSSNADKSNVTDTKFQTSQLPVNENCFLYNHALLHNTFSHNTSVSLPAISISSSDSSLMKDVTNESENYVHIHRNIATVCIDEEVSFNQSNEVKDSSSNLQYSMNKNIIDVCQDNTPEHKYDKNDFEKDTNSTLKTEQSCKEIVCNSQIQTNNDESLNEKNQDEDQHKNRSNSIVTLNSRVRNNLTSRPTLADDSKLVKISLLTNPMNIMQSNVQLLNKSRNFLNFITEKSTNIMEKALLPQHLAMKYNHTLKSVETDTVAAFCTNDKSLRDVICKSDADLQINSNNASSSIKQNFDKNKDKLDKVITNGQEANSSIGIKQNKAHDLESETVLNEKKCIFKETNTCRLDCDITDETAKSDFSLTEINENKDNCVQNDAYKENSRICTSAVSDNSKYPSLEDPLYITQLDYSNLKLANSKLLEKVEFLEKLNQSNKSFKEVQTNTDAYTLQIENLEKTINKLTVDLNESLATQETLRNECIAINQEKDNMVMKYVISEKQLIDSQSTKDSAERKVKEFLKDQELLQNKLRQMQGERTRICNIVDGKCREISELQKEIEKLKEDIKAKEIKIKWTQNKLKTEMDLQKDTQQKLDKALMKINDMKEECEQIRRETQESFRKFQQSEENKAVTLDQQLKEHQARLILERHVTEDKETLRLKLQKELETLKSRQQDLIEENKRLSLKIQESEKARLNYENNLSDLKIVTNHRQEQITELLSKVSHLETLKLQLQHKEECIESTKAQMQQLRSVNEELQSDMQACRQKEADMLDFTQKLTDKNVRLQSEFMAIQIKANHLESEHGPLCDCINELNNKIKALEEDLMQEQKKRKEECEILAKHVAEQTQLAQNLAQKLEDSQGENAVLKRRHQTSVKEMTRELQQCRKKLEIFEAASPSNSLNIASRIGSNTSLNTGDTLNGALLNNNVNDDHIHSIEPSRQALMDRIIGLINDKVRQTERIEFLEEHSQALLKEVQKKTKIIQDYILHQNFGALGCNERDKHKAELARRGGIMASVYTHRVSDENMTLKLSLEINEKLQAGLEEALLKNMTLKDNIDTLGNEIARLTMQHQQRQIEN